MSESITLDEKGRLLIPKSIRKGAGINPPAHVLAIVRGEGRIELIVVDPQMRSAREVARRKLGGWREEEHEPERLGLKLASKEND